MCVVKVHVLKYLVRGNPTDYALCSSAQQTPAVALSEVNTVCNADQPTYICNTGARAKSIIPCKAAARHIRRFPWQ